MIDYIYSWIYPHNKKVEIIYPEINLNYNKKHLISDKDLLSEPNLVKLKKTNYNDKEINKKEINKKEINKNI